MTLKHVLVHRSRNIEVDKKKLTLNKYKILQFLCKNDLAKSCFCYETNFS